MKNSMLYKGYYGSVEYSDGDECFYGKVIGMNSLITFEGSSVSELKESFHMMIDEYLEDCKKEGIEPERQFRGSFNVRIAPELHRQLSNLAARSGVSLNAMIERAVREYVKKI